MALLDTPVEWAARAVASVGSRLGGGRVAILTYHRVLERRDPLLPEVPDAATFAWQLRVLAQHFVPLRLDEAVASLREGRVPPRAVCVTFDDGYADNARIARPALLAARVPATFFVATGFLGGGRMFNDTVIESVRRLPGPRYDARWLGLGDLPLASPGDRRSAIAMLIDALKYRGYDDRRACVERLAAECSTPLPDDLMMTPEEVRSLAAAGMQVGGHTRGHPILARLDPAEARREIETGRDELAAIVGRPVNSFAYPNGRPGRDYLPEHVQMVRDAGFDCAVSTAWAVASPASDPHALPRMSALGTSPAEFAARLARGFLERG